MHSFYYPNASSRKKKLHGTALWFYSPATRSGPDVLCTTLSSNNYYYNILIIFNNIIKVVCLFWGFCVFFLFCGVCLFLCFLVGWGFFLVDTELYLKIH